MNWSGNPMSLATFQSFVDLVWLVYYLRLKQGIETGAWLAPALGKQSGRVQVSLQRPNLNVKEPKLK